MDILNSRTGLDFLKFAGGSFGLSVEIEFEWLVKKQNTLNLSRDHTIRSSKHVSFVLSLLEAAQRVSDNLIIINIKI